MSESKTVQVSIENAIATITFNRPAKRNAMSPSLHLEMAEVLEKLRYEKTSRVVVLTGAGDAFCAGMDLKQFFVDLKDNPAEFDRIFRIATEWRFRTLRYYPKPTIAMVNGYCFGGAFSIVEGCDLAFAAKEATFGLSEINFKHYPGGSVSKSLANLLRPRDALFYGMTGRTFQGDRAAEIGFVNAAYPLAELKKEVMALAQEIASKDPDALTACKEAYHYSLQMTGDAAINFAAAKSDQLSLRQNDSWRSEGIGDFLQGNTGPASAGISRSSGQQGRTMTDVLKGVRVVELGTMITAPLAGMMLADLGAEVIKVEHPDGGDPFRSFRGGYYSPHFVAYNRGKRSIKLDLRSDAGRDILRKLIARADVLLENYRAGVMERLGFGADVLAATNARLIHCSITGFGATGPYSTRPAYDSVGLALSGIASLFLDPDEPQATGPTIPDNATGMYACTGILGALYERARTGKGRRVEVNMLEAAISFIPDPFANHTQMGIANDPLTRVASSHSFAFRCADGKLLAVHLSSQPKFWEGLLAALEHPELAEDERFKTRDRRIENFAELTRVLGDLVTRKPRAQWMTLLEANDVPFAPVHDIPDVLGDPQVKHLETFRTMKHPTEGDIDSHPPPDPD